MAKFSRLEKAMALVIGIDIAAPGFSRAAAKQTVTALSRTAAYVAPRAAAAIPAAAAYSPVATGAALGLGALASPPGQTLLDIAEERGRMDRIRFEQAMTDLTQVAIPKAKKRTKSKFNKMVSSGMKTVRASTSMGAKGKITNAKKAFSLVTKAASAVTKKHKLPKSGIKRKIMTAMRRIR
jgi:hypothetical protein|tara:strand:- start:301 stop:843 length:543 start_codon:yes stop_codon:yes gene_type:complete